jgi:hypothetical protein
MIFFRLKGLLLIVQIEDARFKALECAIEGEMYFLETEGPSQF